MSSDSTSDWLNSGDLKSATARRFAEFCKKDFQINNPADEAENRLYQEAAQMIIARIEELAAGDKQ